MGVKNCIHFLGRVNSKLIDKRTKLTKHTKCTGEKRRLEQEKKKTKLKVSCVESRWNIFFYQLGSKVVCSFVQITFIYLLCVLFMCWERREWSIINGFKWSSKFGNEVLSLTTRYRRLSHRLRHIRVIIYIFLNDIRTVQSLLFRQKRRTPSHLVYFFGVISKLNINRKKLIQKSNNSSEFSLSFSLIWFFFFFSIVTKKYFEKKKTKTKQKKIIVCASCVCCGGRSETFFFVLNGRKTDLTTRKKNKHSGICLFWFYVFAILNFPTVEKWGKKKQQQIEMPIFYSDFMF